MTTKNMEMSSQDLFDFADWISGCADALHQCWIEQITSLPPGQLSNLVINENRLRDLGKNLRAAAIVSVLTDLKDPTKELKSLTDKIKVTIADFNQLNAALNLVAKLIGIASTILNVATKISLPPAAIADKI